MDIKKLKTKDILELDVYKLDKDSMLEAVKRLTRTANQRIYKLINKGYVKKGYINTFSLKGINKMTRNELERTLKPVKQYLERESSTIRGIKALDKRVIKEASSRGLEFDDPSEASDFYNVYREWEKSRLKANDNKLQRFSSFEIQTLLYDRYVKKGLSGKGAKISLTRYLNQLEKSRGISEYEEELKEMQALFVGVDETKPRSDF